MRSLRWTTWPCLLTCLTALTGLAAEPELKYDVVRPAELKLLDQKMVVRAPSRASWRGVMWGGVGFRWIPFVYFSIESGNPAKGSQWYGYDLGQKRPVALIKDMNLVCGQEAKPGVAGQRITDYRDLGWRVGKLLATGAAAEKADFPGGHVVRNEIDLGAVEAGWSVIDIEDRWHGALWLDDTAAWPPGGPQCTLALARSPDGARYRLYGVLYNKIVPLGLEGGPELQRYAIDRTGKFLYYPGPEGAVRRLDLTTGETAAPAAGEVVPELTAPAADGPPTEFSGAGHFLNTFTQMDRREKTDFNQRMLTLAGLDQGFQIIARPATGQPHIYLHRLAREGAEDLGPLQPFEGQPLTTIHQFRVLGGNELVVLAGNDEVTVLQVYESPLLATMTAMVLNSMGHVFADAPAVKARTVANLYEFMDNADRGFDCMRTAADGKTYIGTMPHHPTKGGTIFRYDPAADRIEMLGQFDEFAGNTGLGRVPNMLHAEPFEMHGRLYFTGEDPFYGIRAYPGWSREDPQYYGSPLVVYDLKTQTFELLGVPLPDRASCFYMTGDPAKNTLYMSAGHGHEAWYEVKIGADGKIAGEARKLALPSHAIVHVAPDGLLYYAATGEAPEDGRGPCQIHRLHPATGADEVVAAFDINDFGRTWPLKGNRNQPITNDAAWMHGQWGRESLVLQVGSVGMVVRFDTKSHELKPVGLWAPESERWPTGQTGVSKVMGDRAYLFKIAGQYWENVRLLSMDLGDGRVTDYGYITTTDGREPTRITQMALAADGRILFCGQGVGLPTDTAHWMRQTNIFPYSMISGLFVLDPRPARE